MNLYYTLIIMIWPNSYMGSGYKGHKIVGLEFLGSYYKGDKIDL